MCYQTSSRVSCAVVRKVTDCACIHIVLREMRQKNDQLNLTRRKQVHDKRVIIKPTVYQEIVGCVFSPNCICIKATAFT